MTRPVVLAQISDPHLRVGGDDGASARALRAAVEALAALDPAPDAVLLSGDVADTGSAREYERARELLAPLPMPVHVLAGNHDDRDGLRATFGLPAGPAAGAPLQYATRVGPLRLLVCDATVPGRNEGSYGPDRLAWLDAELAGEPDATVVLAIHHPPLALGFGRFDELGLPATDLDALAALVARSPHLRLIVAGHLHHVIAGRLGGCPVFACQSIHPGLQLRIGPALAGRLLLAPGPPGFALHVAHGRDVTSHQQPLPG